MYDAYGTIIVEPDDYSRYEHELEQAFRLRYEVFVKEKGWTYKIRDDERDFDIHDESGKCVYFLVMEGRKVIGHARLVPGDALNPITGNSEKSRILAAKKSIRGFSLVCVEHDMRGGPKTRSVAGLLFLTACEYALEKGIREFFFETDPSFFLLMRLLGFRVDVHDKGCDFYGGKCVFATAEITPRAVRSCRAKMKLLQNGFSSPQPVAGAGRLATALPE